MKERKRRLKLVKIREGDWSEGLMTTLPLRDSYERVYECDEKTGELYIFDDNRKLIMVRSLSDIPIITRDELYRLMIAGYGIIHHVLKDNADVINSSAVMREAIKKPILFEIMRVISPGMVEEAYNMFGIDISDSFWLDEISDIVNKY